jgi:hypothetical protein
MRPNLLFPMAALLTPFCCSAAVIYSTDFEEMNTSGWSTSVVSTTPGTAQWPATKYLGQFSGNTSVTLTLTDVPAHDRLRIAFDFYAINSWDGSNIAFGPDIWSAGVEGGATLLSSTFSNVAQPGFEQAYPSSFPPPSPELFPAGTGALYRNALGFPFNDAIYRLSFDFVHSFDSVTLRFGGLNLQGVADEGWGLDNLSVEAVVATPEPQGAALVLAGLTLLAARMWRSRFVRHRDQ